MVKTSWQFGCKDFFVSDRAFEDEGKARLGVVECAKHELLQPFTVLNEKEGQSHYHCTIFSPALSLFFTCSNGKSLFPLVSI